MATNVKTNKEANPILRWFIKRIFFDDVADRMSRGANPFLRK